MLIFNATSYERFKESQIKFLKGELTRCEANIKELKQSYNKGFSDVELYRYNRNLNIEQKRKKLFITKLKKEGIVVDGRGRPKKELPEDRYDYEKSKLTVRIANRKLSLLKEIKNEGKIKSISNLIDELIADYLDKYMRETLK